MNEIEKASVNLITMRMSNHASHSGYDRLIDFVKSNKVYGDRDQSLVSRGVVKGLKSYVGRSNLNWYNRSSLIEEISAGFGWLANSNQVFHFLYGENSYRYLGNLKKIKNKNSIVCTYHTPPNRFQEVVRENRHLKQLDAIVTVSQMQLEYLSQYTGRDRTFFVPHGIDVEYFVPGKPMIEAERPLKCLFVGSHMRDVETLVKAADLLHDWGENCEIVAVTALRNKDTIEKSKSINLRMGVDDNELLSLYQTSDLLMLPLLDATANNSILEALACGLPIVSTDLDGIQDYVNEKCAILVKMKDAKGLAEAVVQLSRDASLRQKMGISSREQSMIFSWQNVAEKMNDIYKLVGK